MFTRWLWVLLAPCVAWGQVSNIPARPEEAGIAVTDPLVKAKCGSCHPSDDRGNMRRISWERASPEGWEIALKRMILLNDVDLTPAETSHVLQYLSTRHGLAPEEARGVMYDVERRIQDEAGVPETVMRECARCHNLARSLSWRRSADDWNELFRTHALRYNFLPNTEALEFLQKAAPLHTTDWAAWRDRTSEKGPAGRWVISAYVLGRLAYFGEMQVEPAGPEGEFNTHATLYSIREGKAAVRIGRAVVYGGYAWRGFSKGMTTSTQSPNDLSNQSTDVMTIGKDQSTAQGRWFWGQYQELGLDVTMQRASSSPTLLGIDRPLLRIGTQSNRIRLFGDQFPQRISKTDVDCGPGVTVRRIVSHSATELIAEVDVRPDAPRGKRRVALGHAMSPVSIAIYDRIDYIKVTPDSATAAFGDQTRGPGYQQFEAIAYLYGPDGKRYTADDVELGPIDVNWSLKVFYESEGGNTDFVGAVSSAGLFVPSTKSPANNFDVWVIAETKIERGREAKPLVGKSYLVVTVPFYVFNGRRYVRDLNRWVDDGPASQSTR